MTYKMEVPAMTAVIYARYSSDNQREESILRQKTQNLAPVTT